MAINLKISPSRISVIFFKLCFKIESNHPGEEIGPGLITKIFKEELKIAREEFMKYLK